MGIPLSDYHAMQARLDKGRKAGETPSEHRRRIGFNSPGAAGGNSAAVAKQPLTALATAAAPVVFEIRPANEFAKLNKTERRRFLFLRKNNLRNIEIQAVTLKLGDDCRFTPDFNYIAASGRMVFEDVKGFQRDDALVKIKAAARKFSWATFLIVKETKNGWDETEIKP